MPARPLNRAHVRARDPACSRGRAPAPGSPLSHPPPAHRARAPRRRRRRSSGGFVGACGLQLTLTAHEDDLADLGWRADARWWTGGSKATVDPHDRTALLVTAGDVLQ